MTGAPIVLKRREANLCLAVVADVPCKLLHGLDGADVIVLCVEEPHGECLDRQSLRNIFEWLELEVSCHWNTSCKVPPQRKKKSNGCCNLRGASTTLVQHRWKFRRDWSIHSCHDSSNPNWLPNFRTLVRSLDISCFFSHHFRPAPWDQICRVQRWA